MCSHVQVWLGVTWCAGHVHVARCVAMFRWLGVARCAGHVHVARCAGPVQVARCG